MNLSIAKSITGWMTEEELRWLASQAEHARVIVEVGCWLGRSTRALADNTSGIVHAVDTWQGSDLAEHQPWMLTLTSDADYLRRGEAVYTEFRKNLDDHIKAGRVVPQRGSSLEMAQRFQAKSVDFVFIDAAHDYTSVKADIAAWLPCLKPQSILSGHDYDDVPWHHVKRVVNETFGTVETCGTIWHKVVN